MGSSFQGGDVKNVLPRRREPESDTGDTIAREHDSMEFTNIYYVRVRDLIVHDFPRKVLRFDDMLRTEQLFSSSRLTSLQKNGTEVE